MINQHQHPIISCREPPTYVQPPLNSFRAAVESERKVGVMVIVRVKLSPNINELARVLVARWVQDLGKRRCLGFCITGSFVLVCLRIAKVHGRLMNGSEPWKRRDETNQWLSVRR
jgi:hypothetical protein